MNLFAETLRQHGLRLERDAVTTLRLHVGRKCNQARARRPGGTAGAGSGCGGSLSLS